MDPFLCVERISRYLEKEYIRRSRGRNIEI